MQRASKPLDLMLLAVLIAGIVGVVAIAFVRAATPADASAQTYLSLAGSVIVVASIVSSMVMAVRSRPSKVDVPSATSSVADELDSSEGPSDAAGRSR